MSIKKSLAKLTGMLLVLSSFNSGLTAKAMIESVEETEGQSSFGSQSNLIMDNSPYVKQPSVLDNAGMLIQYEVATHPFVVIATSAGIGGAVGSAITALAYSLGDDSAAGDAAEDAADTQE